MVIAARDWAEGEVVEVAPVIPIPKAQVGKLRGTAVAALLVPWLDGRALVLGDGSLYSKSEAPNLRSWPDPEAETVHFLAARAIRAGEELTVG